jgi:GH25 family lysozyme M1 (1,4-beta-N-acetylmuramidase)
LTLYIHEDSASGPIVQNAHVTGSDGSGIPFDKTTDSSGSVIITGVPGTWLFIVSKSGYNPNSWSQSITATGRKDAFITKIQPIPVTLTLYIHEDSASGPIVQNARVTGSDGSGIPFDKTTDPSGSVVITGVPGTWQFIVSKSGYNPNSWSQSITATGRKDAFITKSSNYLEGLDVSHYQNEKGSINWQSVSDSGKKFVYIKATEGGTFLDPFYNLNIENAKSAGLLIGSYHVKENSASITKSSTDQAIFDDAQTEAEKFYDTTASYLTSGNLQPMLDIENTDINTHFSGDDGAKKLGLWINTWVQYIKTKNPSLEPIGYTSDSTVPQITKYSSLKYVWIARYYEVLPSNTWTIWQYTDQGVVNGITGNVDLDRFKGNTENLISTLGIPASTPTITVTSPNGGELWQRGTPQIIKWDYTGRPGSYVKIVLVKGSTIVGTIKANASIGSSEHGSYTWPISSSGSGGTGSDYKVSVQSINQPAIKDTSDTFFTIIPPETSSITVTSPNGGELWQRGTSRTITWDYTGSPGSSVKIVLVKGSTVVGAIKSSVSIGSGGKGSYTWPIALSGTGGTGNDYKVSIQSISQPAIKDISDSYFTIISPVTPSITVTSPNGGEIWQRGTSQRINWHYTGSPGSYVKIALLKGSSVVGTIKSNVSIGSSGSGSYKWPIALSGSGGIGSDYKVSVQSISQPTIKDTSNNNFTLTH